MNTARSERDRTKDYSEDVYNALREADADFDCVDFEGNSPLHLGRLLHPRAVMRWHPTLPYLHRPHHPHLV